MILGFIKKYIHIYTKQIETLVGILSGTGQSLVNLPNTVLVNTMAGIVIVGKNLIKENKMMPLGPLWGFQDEGCRLALNIHDVPGPLGRSAPPATECGARNGHLRGKLLTPCRVHTHHCLSRFLSREQRGLGLEIVVHRLKILFRSINRSKSRRRRFKR